MFTQVNIQYKKSLQDLVATILHLKQWPWYYINLKEEEMSLYTIM